MDVDPKEVADAEKRIIELEEKLEQVCPIKGKKHRSHGGAAPASPAPKPAEKKPVENKHESVAEEYEQTDDETTEEEEEVYEYSQNE